MLHQVQDIISCSPPYPTNTREKTEKKEKSICLTYGLLCQVWVFLFAATILFKSFRMECGLHVLFALQFLLT